MNFLANPLYCILIVYLLGSLRRCSLLEGEGCLKKNKTIFFFFFGHAALAFGILVPRPGIEPVPPAVESQNPVTTGPPRKSLSPLFITVPGTEQACRG